MWYNGWEVTKLRGGAWKAVKGNNSLMASNERLIKAMINEQEGLPIAKGLGIKNPYMYDDAIKKPSKRKQMEVYKKILKNMKS